MPGEQLFEDYDPDMEEIFGRKITMTAKRVNVTEQQRTDPLRKPKVELQGILVAEKQPITANDIEKRMMNEYGQSLDPKKYGCNTMDDLLQACSDTVVHKRRQDGVHIYWAKVSEANQDIVEMVQQQSSGHEYKRTPKSFLREGQSKGIGTHGSSFRQYKGQGRGLAEATPAKTTPEQHKARNKLGPAKTRARLQNMSELLKECRSEIGKPHPDDSIRIIVTLGALMEKFKQVYGLPAWGKNMSEGDLYNLINVPEFSGVLNFWRLRENGDVFVEEVESDETQYLKEINTLKFVEFSRADPPIDKEEVNGSDVQNSTHDCKAYSGSIIPDSSVDNYSSISSSNSTMQLITEAPNDGFFESGPGFSGNGGPRPRPTVSQNLTNSMTDACLRSGNVSMGATQPSCEKPHSSTSSKNNSRQEPLFRAGSQLVTKEDSECTSSSVQPKRLVPSSFGSRCMMPQNSLKLLVEYIRSRGIAKFESLPSEDQVLVNFNFNIFKVYGTQPGEMLVRLVDPMLDLSTIKSVENGLRDPVEADFRWMTDAADNVKRGRRYVKPVMFVPPRGFLMMVSTPEEEELDDESMTKMESLLQGAMTEKAQEIQRCDARPGMTAVYVYRQESEVRYYRVVITGRAQKFGDVMVLLVDHNDQYIVDVQLSHLFELPEKASFRRYPSNVIFATLYSVIGLTMEEQEIMWKNFDDEDRKKFIVGFIPKDDSKLLSIDMIMKNEMGQLEWLSQIAKRRGAIISSELPSPHLSRSPTQVIERFGTDCFIQFNDYGRSPQIIETELARIEPTNQSIRADGAARSRPVTPSAASSTTSGFSPRNLNVYALFEEVMERRDANSVGRMINFAQAIKQSVGDNPEWTQLVDDMAKLAQRYDFHL